MGLFDLFKKKKENLQHARMLNGGMPIYSRFGDDIYASDVVQQAINCIVREMKKLDPRHIVEKESDIIPQYDRVQAVLYNPNQLMTTSDLIEKIIWMLYLDSNAWICPTWDARGELEGLYPVRPTDVEFLEDKSGTFFVKMWFLNGYECTVKYSDLIHLKLNYSVSEFMGGNEDGKPDHKALLKTLELNHVMLEGVGKALKSSFAINGVVKYNTILDNEKSEKALQQLTEALKNNESGFLPLDLKGEFIPFQRQIAMVDEPTLKFIDEKILRHFGVPLPILTGDYTMDQYNAFYQKTLEPLIKSLSEAFTKALFSNRASFGFGHKIVFYAKKLIFMTTQQKLELVKELSLSGAIYENEKRTIFGLDPLPELVGVRKASLNYVSADIADEYQLGKLTAPKEEPKEEPEEEEPVEEDEPVKEEGEENDEEEVQSE